MDVFTATFRQALPIQISAPVTTIDRPYITDLSNDLTKLLTNNLNLPHLSRIIASLKKTADTDH